MRDGTRAMNEVLRKLRQERDELKDQLQRVSEFIAYLEEKIGREEPEIRFRRPLMHEERVTPRVSFKGVTAAAAAEVILKMRGHPLHLKVIVREILQRGYEKQPKEGKLYNSLYTTMARRPDKFYRVEDKRATFGLVEWREKRPDHPGEES